jgi:histidine triad (HIT) family protein
MSLTCVFCQIVAGRIPAQRVAESEGVLAFRDINPQAPHHILLIPKHHRADSLGDLDDPDVAGEMIALARKVAAELGLEGGWRLVANVGPDAGQSVDHVHFHLLGGRRLSWPPG